MENVLNVLEQFVKKNLTELRKGIVNSKGKEKDTLRIPALNVGSGVGNYQQYTTVSTFKGNDGKDYCIQVRMLSRVVLKSEIQTSKTTAETFEL